MNVIEDNRYEYNRIPLTELESKYIYIPLSVITNTNIDTKRIGIFSYLRMRCGLDNIINFTIPDMVEWCGEKPNKRANCSNEKYLDILDEFSNGGYLTYLCEKSKSAFMKCEFDTVYYYNECSDGYAILYLDEIRKIIEYNNKNNKNNNKTKSITNTTMLLVFAYFRNKIKRRPNELKPEERNKESIQDRKRRLPEAFDGNINDIANEIGIDRKTLLKAIDILECELQLIITDRAYRIKNEKDEFRTLPTIFANAYKREDRYLLDTEREYSRNEIEIKAENMKEYYKGYKINKTKRKG